eukprot:553941-Pelagomonas_calceolata.AAC.1
MRGVGAVAIPIACMSKGLGRKRAAAQAMWVGALQRVAISMEQMECSTEAAAAPAARASN